MNLHTLDLHTMGSRHLVLTYAGVWILQGSYLAWIAWHWAKARQAK